MPADLVAAVFDMDGVLIDSHPTHRAAWLEFLLSVGITPSTPELDFILEGRTRTEILHHFLGERPETELQEYGRRKDEIFRRLERDIKLAPGVREFLVQLERLGIRRAIATSASEIRTASTIERLGLGGFFDAVVTAADVRAGKPDPEVYQIACSRMNVAPQFALAFDDAPAGVIAARSAGLRCIGVTSNGGRDALLAAGAEAVITGFPNYAWLRADDAPTIQFHRNEAGKPRPVRSAE
jgi:HAD superfamily hydrolase (TIGR01509 family)